MKKIYNKNPYLLYVFLGFTALITLTFVGINIEEKTRNTESILAILVFLSFFLAGRGKKEHERSEGVFTGIIIGFITLAVYFLLM